MTDIIIKSGTTRTEAITLTDNNPLIEEREPIILTLCTDIVWVVVDNTERVVIRKHLTDSGVVVIDALNGVFNVFLLADDTSPAFGIGSATETMTYTHETRVIFSDGTQEVIFSGALIILPTKSWKAETLTAGDDRCVFVQGRY
jgi:hypothetical protein